MSGPSSSSLAKLTSVSTLTLSLLLERQRMHSLSPSTAATTPQARELHLPQIRKNLTRLRRGILELESSADVNGKGNEATMEALRLLRGQYERMRGMLGVDAVGAEVNKLIAILVSLEPTGDRELPEQEEASVSLIPTASRTLSNDNGAEQPYTPYTDNPDDGVDPHEQNGILLQTQRRMMDEQDVHLDHLSHSITRQHHISLQINDELDVHHGLLEELDTDLDRTEGRLSRARRNLDRVARGVRNNGSTVTIGLLIFVLLILIIIFKT
ncbi:hypothetical protein H0H87_009806 [Tephrocybe sp. NHM501043]|nr:hypothetical protein H0H87_009806 [Tephrocybe sp. NHM501043]